MSRASSRYHERRRRKLSSTVEVSRVHDGDVYVRVNSIGTEGTRPFVLVPGIGVSSTYFEKLAPHLNEFGPVHALDLPGFGGVPHPEHTMSIRNYADLVGKVIDELQLDDPIVVGHSMGSQIVSDLVSRRPEISTLVLIGPVIHEKERRILTQAVRFLQAAWHEPGTVKILALSSYLLCGVKWFARILPKMMTFPMEKCVPDIAANTLVIRGEFDAVSPREWVEKLGKLLPKSTLWEIEGAAHSVMYAHAETVADLCVKHAREGATPAHSSDDDTTLHVAHEGPDGPDADKPSPKDVVQAVAGRVTETVGILRDDDEAIAEGKSATAKAIEDEEGEGQ